MMISYIVSRSSFKEKGLSIVPVVLRQSYVQPSERSSPYPQVRFPQNVFSVSQLSLQPHVNF
ncbi:hypothetical protein BD310DRAFT_185921 [Dichomitus squalens]|uniref:Uncharacterized protein n=1 Tax=Dichomitus squalens TaxID=114155 RepID=A0A4Q9PDQ4_9APHY|nr:hypothetical protein BD310DRAFT_185921 [Dichomitus squalens]